MGIKFANFVETTIADVGGVSAVATEFTVNAGDGALFPVLGVGDHCVIVCVTAAGAREIMHVTAVSTDTLTVVRARESTTGLVFAQDDVVQLRVTAGSLELLDDLDGLTSTPAELEAAADAVAAATDAATVSTLMERDAAGRAKVVAPSVAADIALKSTVTADIATHNALATAHGSVATVVTIGGDFDGTNNLRLSKVGNQVMAQWDTLACSSDSNPTSAPGVIPAAYRPITSVYGTNYSGDTFRQTPLASTGGNFSIGFRDHTGSLVARTFAFGGSLSWLTS